MPPMMSRKRTIPLLGLRWTSVRLPDLPRGSGLGVDLVATDEIDAGVLSREDFQRFSRDDENNFRPTPRYSPFWKQQKRIIQLAIPPTEKELLSDGTLVIWNAYNEKKEEVLLGMTSLPMSFFL